MNTKTKKLVLGGVLVALGTVLSLLKIFDVPYGGSITLCSMLPVMLFGYLAGVKWGLAAGFLFSVIQLLLGLSNCSYLISIAMGIEGADAGVKTATAIGLVVVCVLLDYLLAFLPLGLAGAFRGRVKNAAGAFTLGALLGGLLRFAAHFLSGWLLWAQFMLATDMEEVIAHFFPFLSGFSGNGLALMYSLVYNGSYMVPEIAITCVAAFLVMRFAGKPILKLAGEEN